MAYEIKNYWKDEEWMWDEIYGSLAGGYYTKKCLNFIFSFIKNNKQYT